MDKRERDYYLARFHWRSREMRTWFIKMISPKIKCHDRENGIVISCPKEKSEAVEYELRKAERRDEWAFWKKL